MQLDPTAWFCFPAGHHHIVRISYQPMPVCLSASRLPRIELSATESPYSSRVALLNDNQAYYSCDCIVSCLHNGGA